MKSLFSRLIPSLFFLPLIAMAGSHSNVSVNYPDGFVLQNHLSGNLFRNKYASGWVYEGKKSLGGGWTSRVMKPTVIRLVLTPPGSGVYKPVYGYVTIKKIGKFAVSLKADNNFCLSLSFPRGQKKPGKNSIQLHLPKRCVLPSVEVYYPNKYALQAVSAKHARFNTQNKIPHGELATSLVMKPSKVRLVKLKSNGESIQAKGYVDIKKIGDKVRGTYIFLDITKDHCQTLRSADEKEINTNSIQLVLPKSCK